MNTLCSAFCALILPGLCALGASGPSENLIGDPGFDQTAANAGGNSKGPYYSIVDGKGRNGTRCLMYNKETEKASATGKKENCHYDLVVPVGPDATYVVGAWFKTEGDLRPSLRISTMDWQTLAAGICGDAKDWQEVRAIFRSGKESQIRFQIFGGGKTEARETAVGTSYCDDVSARKGAAEDLKALNQCRVTVDARSVLREINPLFFGVNTLFWIEDDASLKDGKIAKCLREMPCRLLRFPGGEVGDNYHWKTKTLDNIKQFPSTEGPDKLDCDKFMSLCRQVGAEPIFMTNLESGFVHGDIDAAVREAADWVRYANKEKQYGVKYWEIGNETYLAGTYYPTTAREYAEAFVKFSRAMKAVDPTIQIAACGPMAADTVVPVDQLSETERKENRDQTRSARKTGIKETAAKKAGAASGDPWWPTVVRIAGADMDFAIVHRYYPSAFGPDAHADRPIVALKKYFHEAIPGREIPIALTEWNANKGTPPGIAPALIVAEVIGDYLKGGVDMACFWPMRYKGPSGFRALLDAETNEPKASYYVMKLYSSNMGPGSKLIQSGSSNPSIYTTASQSADGLKVTVFLLNKTGSKEPIEAQVVVEGFAGKAATGVTLAALEPKSDKTRQTDTPALDRDGQRIFQLPPDSLTAVTVE